MQTGVGGRGDSSTFWFSTSGGCLQVGAAALALLAAACSSSSAPDTRNGLVGGRVLVAPGAGLAGAHVVVDQVNLTDGKGEIRTHIGEATTDAQGYFDALPTGTINGLILIDVSGGSFTEPINGAHVQLDASSHLKALHWLGVFEDRSKTMYVTPVHSLVEARFRFKMTQLADTTKAVKDAYAHLGDHFGAVDWDKVIPADLTTAATSPTDEVRAAFVLGGLAFLADDIREKSNSTAQVVNVMTLVNAIEQDLNDQLLDGNDMNKLGGGLQVGECPAPAANCGSQPATCALSLCRTLCDLYVNSYRSTLSGGVSKFISTPSLNHTGLASKDASALIQGIAQNLDMDLFGDPSTACVETADRVPPTIIWEDPTPADGAFAKGAMTIKVRAVDETSVPTVRFPDFTYTDGDSANDVAVATLDTRSAMLDADGFLTVKAEAVDMAGNVATAMRRFQIDNGVPVVTIDRNSPDIVVNVSPGSPDVWWTGTDGPRLHGTVNDAHPDHFEILVNGAVVFTGMPDGAAWSATLPPGSLVPNDNVVTVRVFDKAGNAGVVVQTIRYDNTPPSINVPTSLVFDEVNSDFNFKDNTDGTQVAEHAPKGTPVDLATTGSCPTVNKHVHLLSQPGPGGAHTVLGSSGVLNPLTLNVAISDDGVGIQPGSAEYRVGVQPEHSSDIAFTQWFPMPPRAANDPTSHLFFYRDGVNGIPALGTTNGTYHVEFHATDRFGRTSSDSRCWTHVILAPPLRPTTNPDPKVNDGGEKASGFSRALFSTKLDPQAAGETGDFAAKFLDPSSEGAAVWRWRIKNYLGEPVFVTVNITQDASASVSREFKLRNTFVDSFSVHENPCGTSSCATATPTDLYVSPFSTVTQSNLHFRARLFTMSGNESNVEIPTCPGCTDNDTVQQFQIPARIAGQGIPEYEILTYLQTTLPAGQGTDVTMAPSDGSRPSTGPYSEFTILGSQLTGKLVGGRGGSRICILDDGGDNGIFTCLKRAFPQQYLALTRIVFTMGAIETNYLPSATPLLPPGAAIRGPLLATTLSTDEAALP